MPLLLAAFSCMTQLMSESERQCEDHPLHASLRAADDRTLRVIVALVADAAESVAQRQDRLLTALRGTEHTVLRRSDNFPIITLAVSEAAFCRLVASPLVHAIQRDVPEPSGT